MIFHVKRLIKRAIGYLVSRKAITKWNSLLQVFLKQNMGEIHPRLASVDFEDSVDDLDRSWRLPDKQFPYSCTDEEGLVLAYAIIENQLSSGFEVATAFGFSSSYIGMAFKQNRGKLISMDCFVEEWKESYLYEPEEMRRAVQQTISNIKNGEIPKGLTMARSNAALLALDDTVSFEIGVSPEDVPSILNAKNLDFAFIDGGHFGDQPAKDFAAIQSRLADRCAVFFHDNNGNPSVARAVEAAEKFLGAEARIYPTRYRLTLVGRGLNSSAEESILGILKYRRAVL